MKLITNQKVKLIYISPLVLISNAIRYSRASWDKNDSDYVAKCEECGSIEEIDNLKKLDNECNFCGNKKYHIIDGYIGENDFSLIERVAFKKFHQSVLEFGSIVFDIKMSAKALLEESTHRIAVSQTVCSSRYALRKIDLEYELTDDEDIDGDIDLWMNTIRKRLEQNKPLDKVSKMLPQAFLYRLQLQFNLRSLLHFLKLRLAKSAHIDIRKIAYMMFYELPKDYQELLKEDEVIKKHLIRCKDEELAKELL